MILKFSVDYSERELEFLQKHGCEILSEINDFVWAALSKWKGVYHCLEYYDSLESLEQGM